MVLLDDSNSYWWLVNVLKADEVGYIPAENIETPNDRLARLNKMRNVEVRSLYLRKPTILRARADPPYPTSCYRSPPRRSRRRTSAA